jgi:hypothetical protein
MNREEIEKLADAKYLKRAEEITDSTIRGYILSAVKGGFVDGYLQCQEDMADKLREAYENGASDAYLSMPPH